MPDDPTDVPKPKAKSLLEETRIIIRPDGEVVIENLSELLAEVALELDPDADMACEVPAPPAQAPKPDAKD